jgi:hypothetical protein
LAKVTTLSLIQNNIGGTGLAALAASLGDASCPTPVLAMASLKYLCADGSPGAPNAPLKVVCERRGITLVPTQA